MTPTSVLDLPAIIRRAGRMYPNAPAVADSRVARSLAQVVDRAERFANALDGLGVDEGGPIGILMENRAEYVDVDLGIALARRVRVALNARLALDDFRYMLRDAGATVLVHSDTYADEAATLAAELGLTVISAEKPIDGGYSLGELLAAAPGRPLVRSGDPEDPAWISYTSGTTGRPKGVVLSHRCIREVALNLLLELGPVTPGEQIVLAQSLSHGAGYFVLPYLMSGAGVHIMRAFDPEEAIRLSGCPGVRTFKMVPAMMSPLIEASMRVESRFTSLIYGAAPMSEPVLEQAIDRFGAVMTQIYGQSEAPATLTCLPREEHAGTGPQRFSAGRPWRSVALELRDDDGAPIAAGDVGEVCISGAHMMSGYHGLPETTAEVLHGGWLRTRDMAVRDERGFVYLQGRRDEMINSGGYNISPREVERVLVAHPDVIEVAVTGLPDERWGTAVSAVVVARDGSELGAADLIAFSRTDLGFRVPRHLAVVAEIPRTAYGKVDLPRVREILEGEVRA